MKRNVGTFDRVVRIVGGIVFIIAGMAIAYEGWLVIVGFLIVMTGVIGWCPIYKQLGGTTYHSRHYSQL